MHTEVRHCLERAENDASVRIVVITGDPAGRTFCPGADGKALSGHAERGGYDPGTPPDLANPGYGIRSEFDADFSYFLGLETMTIAAINGGVAGVGLALACWCDVRFAVDGAKFTTAHGRLNLPAEFGLSWLLPRLIGLVNRVTTAGRTLDEALEYADSIVANVSPNSLRATKRQIALDTISLDPASSVNDANHRLNQMMGEDDYIEAAAAFNDKRQPKWGT